MMMSSLSVPHGRRGFNFGPNPNPRTPNPPFLISSHIFFSYPSNSSSSSHKLRLTSQLQPQPPRNESLFTIPTELISTRRARRLSFLAPFRCGISSNGYSDSGGRGLRGWIEVLGEALSTAFPVWVALGCLLGLVRPSSFNWVQPKWTILGLILTMLGMGMTLTFDDLRGALAMPKELVAGFVLQYSVCSDPIQFSFVLLALCFWLPLFSGTVILWYHLL